MVSLRAYGRTLVLALVLVAPVVPASAQSPEPVPAIIGPELPVSYPVELSGGGGGGGDINGGGGGQVVAYGGGVFLVAWTDDRQQVRVSRVDRNGSPIDRYGTRLSEGGSRRPSVAFDGTNFLVVWGGNGPVQGRRVSPAGVVLDEEPIELSPSVDATPEVAFGGGTYLVVWTALAAGADTRDVFGTRVRPDGVVLDPPEPIVAPGRDRVRLDIAFDGTHHLLVWDQSDAEGSLEVRATLVGTDGVALGPDRPISTADRHQVRPVVTATGAGFFVAWDDFRGDTSAIYGARVRADGSVADPAGILISGPTDPLFGAHHDASSDGVNAFVTWETATGAIRGARVSPAGTVLELGGVELADGRAPASAFDGTHHLVVSAAGGVEAVRVTRSLAPLDPDGVVVSTRANRQTEYDVAFDGVNHFVVWTDDRINQGGVFGARVGPDGQVLDGTGFAISEPTARFARRASVAFDGTNFLVVWLNSSDVGSTISAARISRSGEILGRFVVDGPAFVEAPAVAFGNGVFLVAWSRFEVVTVARVSPDGTVLDPGGIPLASVPGPPEVDVAAGASEFLVVWQDGDLIGDPEFDVFGAVVSSAGTVVTPAAIPLATGPLHEENARVAWHDGTYLVAWGESPDHGFLPPGLSDIRGTRVDAAGTILDPAPIPISIGPESQQFPDVAVVDGRFLVAWTDRRRRAVAGERLADVYGTTVDPAGTVRSEFLIGVTENVFEAEGARAALAARPGHHDAAVVYGRYLPDEPYGTTRALLRRVFPK